jgi:hypothetical protein
LTREEAKVNDEMLVGKFVIVSGWYVVGHRLSLFDIEKSHGKESNLYKNMDGSYDHVVKTKFGNYVTLEKEDHWIPGG